MITPMSSEEILRIGASLEDYHAACYQFWCMSSISFDDSMPTACVRFHPDQKPDILINPDFWTSLTHREQLFVICHETLHVILMHDSRNGKDIKGATPQLVNVAQDITINEMIVDLFGYDKTDLRDWKKYCWIETCFKHPPSVKRNETFRYYLELLIKEQKQDLPQTVDEHSDGTEGAGQPGDKSSGSSSPSSEEIEAAKKKVAQKLAEELTADELEDLINAVPENDSLSSAAGTMASTFETLIGSKRKKKKIHFEKILKKLKRSSIKESIEESESFVRDGRRFSDVMSKSNIALPGTHDKIVQTKTRLLTAVFMDISGSCISYLPTFNSIIEAFMSNTEMFELRAFTFDTRVTEVKSGQRVWAGGGTSFKIIGERVEQLKTERGRYPDCVIVITDGEGDKLSTTIPNRWIWMLTPNPSYNYIPPESRRYLISEVVF